jgi:hypothetical protein
LARTGAWSDWTLPNRTMRFLVDGEIETCNWTTVAERARAAFSEFDMSYPEDRKPPYTPEDWRLFGTVAGSGWIVGESDLQKGNYGLFRTQGFQSFILTIQVWIEPPRRKGDLDSEMTPHRWKVQVRAGRVCSAEVSLRSSGIRRQYRGTVDTEEAFGWIAPAILNRLASTQPP